MTGSALPPLRLGHVELFVKDLASSVLFYRDVCGLQEILRQPSPTACFVGNGTSHYDVALVQVPGLHVDSPRAESIGSGSIRSGVSHLAFEMETEGELVKAYERCSGLEALLEGAGDRGVTRGVYLRTPDGIGIELFASSPATRPAFERRPRVLRVAGSQLHPSRLASAALLVHHLAKTAGFFTAVIGLQETFRGDGFAALSGKNGHVLTVLEAPPSQAPGLHHVAFELEGGLPDDAPAVEHRLDRAGKQAVFLRDPDGLWLEFFASGTSTNTPPRDAAEAALLL